MIKAVFFPYKASMWDSLESIWMAADSDEDCEAVVVPIPYFDRNPDGTFGSMHCDADLFPDYVPVVSWRDYDLESDRPDVVYIHNPYDKFNNVTCVYLDYFSGAIRPFTKLLVYVPYYATAGGMSADQSLLPSYFIVDNIVIQSPVLRQYFDESVPDEKFLPFGSPKFDRIIKNCENPPEPPEGWKAKMAGKKVYFYNTSLGGMLADTEVFLGKMEYVFDTFRKYGEAAKACLLWRPHPLFESTMQTMRPELLARFERLKRDFLEEDHGIFDETADISKTIALCDAYIGDAGTSVTSLFGIAGKPLFILDNQIQSENSEGESEGDDPGFTEYPDGYRYCCMESAANTLRRFIFGDIAGARFDGGRQREAFADLNASPDGTCGQKVHEFVKGRLL